MTESKNLYSILCEWKYKHQRTTKPMIRRVRSAKTQISLRIRAVWSESSLIACLLYPPGYQTGIKENPCYTGWMYKLIWVFAGHTGLIVGFVVRWLIKWRHKGKATITKHKLPEGPKQGGMRNKDDKTQRYIWNLWQTNCNRGTALECSVGEKLGVDCVGV